MRGLALLFILLTSQQSMAGWYVGNGGDGITCRPSPDNKLNGIYSLDYILTLPNATGPDGVAHVASWDDSSTRLLKLLTEKVPTLASSFREFSRLVYNRSFTELRVWEPAPFGLVDLDDQRITSLLPANCKADGKVQVIPAVIRQYEEFSGTKPGRYVYKYFPDVLADMDRTAPAQLSYLLVHEWLWDVSTNVDRNRRVNRLLHSTEIEGMTPEQVAASLQGMGMVIPEVTPDSFDADQWQGYPMTQEKFFQRFQSGSTLVNLGQMRIDYREKVADCTQGTPGCNPGWRSKRTFYTPVFDGARFFLAAGWDYQSGREYPLKIVSPELIFRNGGHIRNNSGEIECKFDVANPGQLDCRFIGPDLIHPLFGVSTYELRPGDYPVMKAQMTEECFRLLAPATRTVHVSGSNGSFDQKYLTETAFTLRFKWK